VASGFSTWAGRVGRLVPRAAPERGALPYVAWTVAWFVVALVLTFPHDLIVRDWVDKVSEHSDWQLRFDDVWLRPWNGYHLSQVEVVPRGKATDPWLTAGEVVLRPPFGALFGRGVIPLAFSGDAYGGDFTGSVDSPTHVRLNLQGLRLGEYSRLTRIVDGKWTGELSGETEIEGKDLRSLEGKISLHLKDASLTQGKVQGFTVPDLHFASGEAQADLKGGRIEIGSVKLAGSEVDAELRGQIYLFSAGNVPVVNGTLTLRPIPGAAANLEPLLMLWNKNQKSPNGVYTLTISGPLSAPRIR